MSKGIKLLIDGVYGIHIPECFADRFHWDHWNISKEDNFCLSLDSEESEHYWETWESVLNNAYHIDEEGNRWTLYQDGDLFAVCPELISDSEYEEFFGEDRQPSQ